MFFFFFTQKSENRANNLKRNYHVTLRDVILTMLIFRINRILLRMIEKYEGHLAKLIMFQLLSPILFLCHITRDLQNPNI